ncbi:PREDICTED: complement factor H-like, partial [Acanthisitta chloris]|uniref:complement factor H-like n=1 Tax=Acanthisitta chloris TaxID=57068 RepID=UPI0004F0F89C
CEEPPPRRVKEVPTKRWDKPPYPHGTEVTYTCRPGYMKLGRITFQCVNGAWVQQRPLTECKNKPCGHPGDTEFGFFELTSGKEFVFGARVEYRCNDGYQMLSPRNYRECQADGWSNDIPHCEVVKCLPLQAPENGKIVMTGVFDLDQEYYFGQVVNFECNADYHLVGAESVICSSNGKWSSDVPQCKVNPTLPCLGFALAGDDHGIGLSVCKNESQEDYEVICDVPEILHGRVHSAKQTYRKSEYLQFACDRGYAYGERSEAQCTETGWNPRPYCT